MKKLLLLLALAGILNASAMSVRLNMCFDQMSKMRHLIEVVNQKQKFGESYDWEIESLKFRYFKGVEYCGKDGMSKFQELFIKYGIFKEVK